MSDYSFTNIPGPELGAYIRDLARLRITVFSEFPYLYEGDLDYEADYLKIFTQSPNSLIVLMKQGDEVVGASTCLPLADEDPAFIEPFTRQGLDPARFLYLSESIILRPHRGSGAGAIFFERREAQARKLGLSHTAFCAVDRPSNHPARPAGYRPLDAFWTRQGYSRQPTMQAQFNWRDIGDEAETSHSLTFWTKEL